MTDNANELFESLSRQLDLPPDEVKSSCQAGDLSRLTKNIGSERARQVESILADPEKTKELLDSPEAQELLRLLNTKLR